MMAILLHLGKNCRQFVTHDCSRIICQQTAAVITAAKLSGAPHQTLSLWSKTPTIGPRPTGLPFFSTVSTPRVRYLRAPHNRNSWKTLTEITILFQSAGSIWPILESARSLS